MSRFDFVSPGAAATDAISKALIEQEVQRRQAVQDQLAQEANQRANAAARLDDEVRRAQLQQLGDERAASTAKTNTDAAAKIASLLTVGSTVDPATEATLAKGGMGMLVAPKTTLPTDASAATTATPGDTAAVSTPTVAMPATAAAPTGEKVYTGTPDQQAKERARSLMEQIRNDPQYVKNPGVQTALRLADATGNYQGLYEALAKMQEAGQGQDVFDVSADRKTIRRRNPATGQMEPFTGVVPKDAKFLQEPQPPQATYVGLTTPEGVFVRNSKDPNAKLTPVTTPDGSQAQPGTTAATRSQQEAARMVLPHIDEIANDASALDKTGLFGPLMSRIRNTAAKLGTVSGLESDDPDKQQAAMQALGDAVKSDPSLASDRLSGKFATELGLLMTATARAHGGARGGGSPLMLEHFKELLTDNSTLPMFQGRLDALKSYMDTYAGNTVTLRDPKTGVTKTVSKSDPRYQQYITAGAEVVK